MVLLDTGVAWFLLEGRSRGMVPLAMRSGGAFYCFCVNKAEYMIIILYKMKITAVATAVIETFPHGNVAKIAREMDRVKRAASARSP
jgi:hypothetical protein